MGNIATGHEFITKIDTAPEKWKLLHKQQNLEESSIATTSRKTKDKLPLPAYGILLPLVTSESGHKFGKSEHGQTRIWLSASKTSPFDFYQFFLRLPDSQIEKMLHFYSLLPPTEIDDLMNMHQKESEKRHPHQKVRK